MIIHGHEILNTEIQNQGYFLKAIANTVEAAFFPGSIQHRDMKISGLSYEDDYKGNAVACVIQPGQIQVRFHKRYQDGDVERIFRKLFQMPELSMLSEFDVSYQGRPLTVR